MNLLSLFSGIGAFEKALDNEEIKFNLVNYCEIDKYASKSYAAIHNVSESLNLHDVTNIDTSKLSNIDLITYGFPCQDISIAGKQKGFKDEEGNNTRSGLFFEALRIIKDTKPKYAIAENVKALTSKKFQAEFNTVLSSLNDVGYNNYYQVLNAKDYGIPQNRERVFIVSIRKDIDDGSFRFPEKMELKLKLKDLLENEVDEKYYLSKEVQERFTMTDPTFEKNIIGTTKPACRTIGQRDLVYQENSIMGALVATDYKQPKQILQVAQIYPNNGNPQAGRVYSTDGLSPTLDSMRGDNRQPKIIDAIYNHREPRVYSETAPTLRTRFGLLVSKVFKIRKLTPKECWRLMGFDDEDIDKCIEAGLSNSQLYKQAGNSIVVTVLQEILKNLFKTKG